jgi:response regulator RpfG family c-di-GMP phosphodiesterase
MVDGRAFPGGCRFWYVFSLAKEGLPKVLCVDDEAAILEGIARNFRREFDIVTATSPADGLARIDAGVEFETVVSDMHMPRMDGLAFLSEVRRRSPDATRILLTGRADLNIAALAVNEGNVFRFLTKPCPAEQLGKALRSAVEQYRLVTAERVLLEQTLRGSIQTLVRVLSLTSPESFGRASRIKKDVVDLASKLGQKETWELEVAAMLSTLGMVIVPPDVLGKAYRGEQLTLAEQAIIDRSALVADELLAGIPRMDAVRDILRYQDARLDGAGKTLGAAMEARIPVGSRLLKIARDYDTCFARTPVILDCLDALRKNAHFYDGKLLSAFVEMKASVGGQFSLQELPLVKVRAGMIFAADVKSRAGLLLVAHGQQATVELLERLRNVAARMGVQEPLLCQLPG